MHITAVCVTWNRPLLLGRAIHCFLQQTHPNRSLLILDDAGQYRSQSGDGWHLVSLPERFPTLGDKRNAAVDLAARHFPQTEGLATWDDDDIYWPQAIESVAKALEESPWAQPRMVFEPVSLGRLDRLHRVLTYGVSVGEHNIAYGGSWAWGLDAFRAMGGFPPRDNSEEVFLARKMHRTYGPSADSTPEDAWYCYNRCVGTHMCDLGEDAYAIRGRQIIEPVDELSIGWNGPNVYQSHIEPGLRMRPF